MLNKFNPLIHVVFLSIYPVIFLFTRNVVEVEFVHIILPLTLCLILAVLTYLISNKLIKHPIKASLITSLLMVYTLNANLFPIISTVITFLLLIFIVKKEFDGTKFVEVLNTVSIVLIVFCLVSVPKGIYQSMFSGLFDGKEAVKQVSAAKEDSPDIYYIVLDGYANNKALNKYYNFDNAEFLRWLGNKGFYVAENSTSNYMCTTYSVTSSLNMRYINEDLKNVRNVNTNAFRLMQLRQDSEVIQFLKSKGYRFLFIDVVKNDMVRDFMNIADIKYEDKEFNILLTSLNYLIYKNSLLGLLDYKGKFIDERFLNRYFYNSMKNSLINRLNYISNPDKIVSEPKFIYAHVLAPHPPYLFDKYGNDQPQHNVEPNEYAGEWLKKELYLDYLIYINGKIQELITDIFKNSVRPPIIILQSDHGSHYHFHKILQSTEEFTAELFLNNKDFLDNSYGILNAYYFPGKSKVAGLYQTITPVNSFRVLFNNYFDTELDLLEDRNYFGFYEATFDLPDVTDKLTDYHKEL